MMENNHIADAGKKVRLIDANALLAEYDRVHIGEPGKARKLMEDAPTVDAVPVADIEAWLYEMAMNNTGNTLGGACEEIIRRLDGLRRFSKERSTV